MTQQLIYNEIIKSKDLNHIYLLILYISTNFLIHFFPCLFK